MRKHWPIIALVGALLGTLFISYEIKAPCQELPWAAGAQYRNLCYNDIQGLYGYRKLNEHAFPYVVEKTYEYPVLMGLSMWATSFFAQNDREYFRANVPLLCLAALLSLVGLIGAVGPRKRLLWFAAGTPILFYAFLNWDLLPVAFVCLAIWAWSRKKYATTGSLLGLGVAAKVYPGFFLIPLVASLSFREKRFHWNRGALRLVAGAALSWTAVNLPFAVAELIYSGGIEGWFGGVAGHQAIRTPDFGSIWHWLALMTTNSVPTYFPWIPPVLLGLVGIVYFSRKTSEVQIRGAFAVAAAVALTAWVMNSSAIHSGGESDPYRRLVDVSSALVFFAGYLGFLALQIKRPGTNPWRTGAAALALYLMMSKIHSPQHSLWILPLMAAFETSPAILGAYLVSDATLLVSQFTWFATAPQLQTNPWEYLFAVAVFARFLALGAFIVNSLEAPTTATVAVPLPKSRRTGKPLEQPLTEVA